MVRLRVSRVRVSWVRVRVRVSRVRVRVSHVYLRGMSIHTAMGKASGVYSISQRRNIPQMTENIHLTCMIITNDITP